MVSAAGPQVEPIKLLHRHDSYISFARDDEDGFETLFSIRADKLDHYFPEFLEYLAKDAYVSINASYRRTATHRRSRTAKGLPIPYHSTTTLRHLCACYVDIDFRKKRLNFKQTVEKALLMEEQGVIPPFSLVVDSGRGMWLLWLLHDSMNPDIAHHGGWTDNRNNHVQLYVRIQKELNRRLTALGSDPAGIDAARHLRIPGSLNGRSDRRVRWFRADPEGDVCSYTLQDLAERLQMSRVPSEPKSPGRLRGNIQSSSRRRGYDQANANRVTVLRSLCELRGGMDHGHRALAAFYLSAFLRAQRMPVTQAQKTVREMGARCRPPFPALECDRALRSAYRMRKSLRISYSRLAELFDVSPSEAEQISQQIGKPFPSAARSGIKDPNDTLAESRRTRCLKRRTLIKEFVGESQRVPSLREMAALLTSRGIKTSHVTVRADYREMNLVAAEQRKPAKSARSEDAETDLLAGEE